jgi:uncharacterized small protein (DUF1192 family)
MTNTPPPASPAASLPVFGYVIVEHHVTPDTPMGLAEYNTDTYFDFQPFSGSDNIAVVKLDDAESQLSALRMEVERLEAELTRCKSALANLMAEAMEADILKGAPNVEACMALADAMAAKLGFFYKGEGSRSEWIAASEALRKELARHQASELARDFPPRGGLTECDMGDNYE